MKIWFLGSSDGLTPLGVKALIFILEKVIVCLDLEWYYLLFSNDHWGLDTCCRLTGGLCSRIVWVNFFWDVVMPLTPATQLQRLQHVLVSPILSPLAVIVQDMVSQLQSYDERGLHVRSIQQAIKLFKHIHDLVGHLMTQSTVSFRSPKLVRGGRPGTPVSWPIQYDRRSSWMEFLRDICSVMEPIWLLPRGEVVWRELSFSPTNLLKAAPHWSYCSPRVVP